jgi:hypothetical protein
VPAAPLRASGDGRVWTTLLAMLPQGSLDLAITVGTATFDPELLDKAEKASVILGSDREGLFGPGIVTAGRI